MEKTYKKVWFSNNKYKDFIDSKKMKFFRLIEKTEDVIIRMSAK
jgi:hypothetical protein